MADKKFIPSGNTLKTDASTLNVADKMEELLGAKGSEFASDANPHTPGAGKVFIAINVVADAIFSAISPAPSGSTFTGVTIPAGTTIYGRFTTFTLTSGKVLAYKGV